MMPGNLIATHAEYQLIYYPHEKIVLLVDNKNSQVSLTAKFCFDSSDGSALLSDFQYTSKSFENKNLAKLTTDLVTEYISRERDKCKLFTYPGHYQSEFDVSKEYKSIGIDRLMLRETNKTFNEFKLPSPKMKIDKLNINFLKPEDKTNLLSLLKQTYWAEGADENYINNALENSISFVAKNGEGKIIGFVRYVSNGNIAYISDMVVDKIYRKQSIATALMQKLCQAIDHRHEFSALISAREGDGKDAALKLYENKFGFKDYNNSHQHKIFFRYIRLTQQKEIKPTPEILMPDDQSQLEIIKALQAYLKQNKHKPKSTIHDGVCAGLAFLVFYAHWLEHQPIRFDNKGKPIPRDDLTWVKTVIKKLLLWDKRSPFPEDPDVERFISHIMLTYDDPTHRLSHFRYLSHYADTRGRYFKKEYNLPVRLSRNDFKKSFKINGKATSLLEIIIQENKMTYIAASKHATFLTKRGEKYYFYNSNHPKGLLEFSIKNEKEIEELIKLIFTSHFKQKIEFALFDFVIFHLQNPGLELAEEKEEKLTFPAKQELLQQLDFVQLKEVDSRIELKPLMLIKNLKPEELAQFDFLTIQDTKMSIPDFIDKRVPPSLKNKMLQKVKDYYEIVDKVKKDVTNEVIREKNSSEPTLYQEAARAGDSETIQFCLSKGIDVHDNRGKEALICALLSGNSSAVDTLVKAGATISKRKWHRMFLLAIADGNFDLVKTMIKAGIDVNFSVFFHTPLQEAAESGHANIMELLIHEGAKIEEQGGDALIRAAERGHIDIVNLLINTNIFLIYHTDYKDKTALYYAIKNGHAAVVASLLQAGLHFFDKNNENFLFLAVNSGNIEVIHLLLKTGMPIGEKNINGETAFFTAVRNQSLLGISSLLEAKANINEKNNDGKTPIFYALNNMYILDSLIAEKANVNIIDSHGKTPLCYALSSDPINLDLVNTLMKAGAQPTLIGSPNPPPLLIALRKHEEEIFPNLMLLLNGKAALSYALATHANDFKKLDKLLHHLSAIQYKGNDPFILDMIKNIQIEVANATKLLFSTARFDTLFKVLLFGNQFDGDTGGILRILNRVIEHHKQTGLLKFLGKAQPNSWLENAIRDALEKSNIKLEPEFELSLHSSYKSMRNL